jgi:ABC-type uncharacterized transport system permease subunit
MDGVFLCKVTYNLSSNLCGLPLFSHILLYYFAHNPHTFSNYFMRSTSIGRTIRMATRPTKAMREHIIKL